MSGHIDSVLPCLGQRELKDEILIRERENHATLASLDPNLA